VHRKDFTWLDTLPARRVEHPVAHELGERGVVGMLELTPTAGAEMGTGGRQMVGARHDGTILRKPVARHSARDVTAVRSHPVSLGSDAHDCGGIAHD
jgi:hypothetical protein